LDSIGVNDAARLVAELRQEGKSEWTISGIIGVASRVFTFARRRCTWHGTNPIPLLENGERPKVGQTQRRRIFTADELAQTIAQAGDPWKLLFMTAAVTGARESELLGIIWGDVDLSKPDEATISFEHRVDRAGERVALKTDESRREIEIPRQLAALLLEHRASSKHSTKTAFVFATSSGRAIGQRNVLRELRRAQKAATDAKGRPTFPVLHEVDERGKRVPVPRGSVPNFHSIRHTAASEAIAAGDGAEEVSWMLGHKIQRHAICLRTGDQVRSAQR
jgi:integrase